MSNVTVKPEEFSKAVKQLIEKYGDEAYDIAQECSKTAARQTVKEIKADSPVGKQGRYKRGWSHKAQKNGHTKYSETVYNRTDYQLTHLLEKPHDTGSGNRLGHYPTHVDHTGIIARIEEEQTEKFMEEVIAKL